MRSSSTGEKSPLLPSTIKHTSTQMKNEQHDANNSCEIPPNSSPSIFMGDELPEIDSPHENPFVYDFKLSNYEIIKTVTMCILLVPVIRIVLLLALLVPLYVFAFIGTLGHSNRDRVTGESVPLSTWRRVVIFPMRLIIRTILFVLGFYWIKVKYPTQRSDTRARIIIANHTSFIDGIFFVAHCFPSVAMRDDLGNIPLIGSILRSLDPIFIDRKSNQGRKAALKEIHSRPASGKFPDLLIFPEGTTSNSQHLTKFKRGAFTPGLPIQPVILKYPFKHFDLSWPPAVSAGYLAFRLLCQIYVPMEVEYLPVYVPNESEKENTDQFAENVRQTIAAKMDGVSCTNHAFEDVMLLMQLGEYGTHVLGQTDMQEIRNLTAMKTEEVDKLIRHFAANDTNQDGKINYQEMCDILRQEDSPFMTRLFELLDVDGNGQIDFRELCLGLSAISPNFQREEMVRFAFRLYDLDDNGCISKQELASVLKLSRRMSGITNEDISLLVHDFDVDRNGLISYGEFKHMVDERPEIMDKVMQKLHPLKSRTSSRGMSFR